MQLRWVAAAIALLPLVRPALAGEADPQRAALVADWSAMQTAMAHTADDLKAVLARLDMADKDRAELDYWRRWHGFAPPQ